MRRAAVLATILIAPVLAVSACGGEGDSQSAAEWAREFCGAGVGWQQALQTRSAEAQQATSQAEGLEGARTELVGLFEDSAEETDQFASEVEDLGAAPGDDGEAVQEQLVEAIQAMRDEFASSAEEMEGVNVENPQQFQQEAGEIANGASQEIGRIGESISSLDDDFDVPELDRAFEEEPSCQEFQGGGGTGGTDTGGSTDTGGE